MAEDEGMTEAPLEGGADPLLRLALEAFRLCVRTVRVPPESLAVAKLVARRHRRQADRWRGRSSDGRDRAILEDAVELRAVELTC